MGDLDLEFPTRGIVLSAALDRRVAPRAAERLAGTSIVETYAHHAKRDGQVLFTYLEALAECPLEDPRVSGEAGDLFVFGGDRGAHRREGLAQLLLVYGPDNLFVEPLNDGLIERSYGFIGRISQTTELRELSEEIWRRGIERLRITK